MKNKYILLIEDDKELEKSIQRDFRNPIDDNIIGLFQGNVQWADSVVKADSLYKSNYYDLIILDLRLGHGGDGIDFLKQVREIDSLTPILILSGQAEEPDHHEIGKYPNTYFFDKNLAVVETENPRQMRCIELLRTSEENYEKFHHDFYLPQAMAKYLFDEKEPTGTPFSVEARQQLRNYFRDPMKGFDNKGIYGWFDHIGDLICKHSNDAFTKLRGRQSEINIKPIIHRIRGDDSLKTMEDFLNMDPYYRQHFSHQFHVFLIGHLIYNAFKDQILPHIKTLFSKYQNPDSIDTETAHALFEIGWYLTSLFHDNASPVQHFSELFDRYFSKNFHYKFKPRQLIMVGLIEKEGLGPYFDAIVDDFWSGRERTEEFQLLLSHQFHEKNHAIHSAISLRKLVRFNEETTDEFCRLLNPVYSAIALHDWNVWKFARAVKEFTEVNPKIKTSHDLAYHLDFHAELDKNSLLHILLIADTIQSWNRGTGIHNTFHKYRIELIDIRWEQADIGSEKKKTTDFFTFELNVREGNEKETNALVYCKFCQTFKTLSVILGSGGLPVKIILNKGLKRKSKVQSFVQFLLGTGKQINCSKTDGCPYKQE